MIRLVQCGNVAEAMKAEELEEQIGFKSSVKALHKKDDDDDEASPFTFDGMSQYCLHVLDGIRDIYKAIQRIAR
jgi:hypothetical protein